MQILAWRFVLTNMCFLCVFLCICVVCMCVCVCVCVSSSACMFLYARVCCIASSCCEVVYCNGPQVFSLSLLYPHSLGISAGICWNEFKTLVADRSSAVAGAVRYVCKLIHWSCACMYACLAILLSFFSLSLSLSLISSTLSLSLSFSSSCGLLFFSTGCFRLRTQQHCAWTSVRFRRESIPC
jgi:hypothetical protein